MVHPPQLFLIPPQLSQPPQLYSKFFNPPNLAKYWKIPSPPAKAGGVETMGPSYFSIVKNDEK